MQNKFLKVFSLIRQISNVYIFKSSANKASSLYMKKVSQILVNKYMQKVFILSNFLIQTISLTYEVIRESHFEFQINIICLFDLPLEESEICLFSEKIFCDKISPLKGKLIRPSKFVLFYSLEMIFNEKNTSSLIFTWLSKSLQKFLCIQTFIFL